jgi:hypothetical protein
MGGGVWRRSGWLQKMRTGCTGAARLLILAFALQLAVPVFDLGGIAALAGEAALQADLKSSLCHNPNEGPAPQPDAIPGAGIKHCTFCLPMAGNSATVLDVPLPAAPVLAADVIGLQVVDDQIPTTIRPAFARSRAPPPPPRTV